jgi:hypothetical protein
MKRRHFCLGAASAMVLGAAKRQASGEEPPSPPAPAFPAEADWDPAGGYTLRPPKRFLFFDHRLVNPGDLQWLSPDGKPLPVAGPPDPPVEARADAQTVPAGIRWVAQKAALQGPIPGLPNQLCRHDGRYRSWSLHTDYGTGPNLGSYSQGAARSLAVVAAESADGYAWTSKRLDEIQPPHVTGIDGAYFFIDPHGPADERYKCVYNAKVLSGAAELWKRFQAPLHPRYRDTRLGPTSVYCLFGMVSPDGVRWTHLPEPLLANWGDTDNTVHFDEWLGKYVLYTRLYWTRRRYVGRAESEDFRRWTPVEPILRPTLDDPPSWDIYTNARTNYPDLPEYHLMFPFLYRRLTQTSEVHLYTSLNGLYWDRVPGGPVLEPGDPGSWNGEFIVAGKQLVPLGGDRIGIPMSANTHPHKYPRWPGVIGSGTGWATWPAGRLCALRADDEERFDTFPVTVTGRTLRVNVKVNRAGEVRIGLNGVDGRSAAECDPITGDHAAFTVTWGGDSRLRVEPDQTVSLRFRLRAADLFGFEWVA